MNYFTDDMKNIDIFQKAVATITTYMRTKKYEDNTNFITMHLASILDNELLDGTIESDNAIKALDAAVRELDLLEDELNFISQQMTQEILERADLQVYFFHTIYDFDDPSLFTEEIFKELNRKTFNFEDPWLTFQTTISETYDKIKDFSYNRDFELER